jgi:hypothetical protein
MTSGCKTIYHLSTSWPCLDVFCIPCYNTSNGAGLVWADKMTAAAPTVGGVAGPVPRLLWSTNTLLKNRIQQRFLGDKHYVWCSPTFEAAALGRYALGYGQPPTSDPCTIYRQLREAVIRRDEHDPKIQAQKGTLKALAVDLQLAGTLTEDARDEIVAMVNASQLADWRPLIYVIPYAPVAARAELVPRPKRASHEPEYIIRDLEIAEFDIIEPVQC